MTTQDVEHSKLEKLLLEITISRLKGEAVTIIKFVTLLERIRTHHNPIHRKYGVWRRHLPRIASRHDRYAKIIELIKEQIETEKLTAKHD